MSALFSAKNREFLLGPLSKNNPVIVQVLGICSALAVTAKLEPAIVMGLSVTAVTAFSNVILSLMRNTIPTRIRIIVQLVVVAALVIIVDQLLKAFAYDVSKHIIKTRSAVDVCDHTRLLIVIYERHRLCLVHFNSVSYCFFGIVRSLIELSAADIAYAFLFRRHIYDMVAGSAGSANAPPYESCDEFLFLHGDVEHVLHHTAAASEELIQLFCLI